MCFLSLAQHGVTARQDPLNGVVMEDGFLRPTDRRHKGWLSNVTTGAIHPGAVEIVCAWSFRTSNLLSEITRYVFRGGNEV